MEILTQMSLIGKMEGDHVARILRAAVSQLFITFLSCVPLRGYCCSSLPRWVLMAPCVFTLLPGTLTPSLTQFIPSTTRLTWVPSLHYSFSTLLPYTRHSSCGAHMGNRCSTACDVQLKLRPCQRRQSCCSATELTSFSPTSSTLPVLPLKLIHLQSHFVLSPYFPFFFFFFLLSCLLLLPSFLLRANEEMLLYIYLSYIM